MAGLSDYMENQVLLWSLTNAAATRPTAWYVGLYSAAPSEAGGGTELSSAGGSGYARQAVTFTVTGSQAVNNADLVFNSATDWPAITHVGIFDALTGGNMMWFGALAAARDPALGDTIRFAAGQLILEID